MNNDGTFLSIPARMGLNNCITWLHDHVNPDRFKERNQGEKRESKTIASCSSGFCTYFSEFIQKTPDISVSRSGSSGPVPGKSAGTKSGIWESVIFFTAENHCYCMKRMTNVVKCGEFGEKVSIRNDLWQSFWQT